MTNWKSFSQNDTIPKNIQLTTPIARLVVKDLIKGDALSEEVKAIQKILVTTNDKIISQSDLITNLQVQNANLQSIIKQKDAQYEAQLKVREEFEKAFKRERRTKKLYQIGSAIGAAAILVNVLK